MEILYLLRDVHLSSFHIPIMNLIIIDPESFVNLLKLRCPKAFHLCSFVAYIPPADHRLLPSRLTLSSSHTSFVQQMLEWLLNE